MDGVFKNMRALITGITGFVGSHMAEYLLSKNVEVHGVIRWRSPKENISGFINNVYLHYGDILDRSSLDKTIKTVRPDYIFHLAAQSYVPYSFDAPVSTLDTNCIGTCNLLESIKSSKEMDGYDPIVHICSSSEVYGQVSEEEIPIKESNPFRPASPYAVSKIAEDMLALQYWLSWGIKTIRTRLFTHTGPRRGDVFVVSAFAKQISQIEAGLQDPVIKVGNLDSIRTFMDVKDAVKAYWILVQKCPAGEVYNIGGNETMSIREMLAKMIKLSACKNIKIETDKNLLRPSDVTLQIPDCSKFKKYTGWEPEVSFIDTLRELLQYWRQRV
jgi:GDP-mannose 4,6-dehydratase